MKSYYQGKQEEEKGFIAFKRIYNLMVGKHGNNRKEWAKIMVKIIAKILCGISQSGSYKLKHLSCTVANKCSHSWAAVKSLSLVRPGKHRSPLKRPSLTFTLSAKFLVKCPMLLKIIILKYKFGLPWLLRW